MINTLYGLGFVVLLSTVWTSTFGTVTTIPYGIDEALVTFMEQINIIINLIPPFGVIWNVFLIGLTVKLLLLAIEWSMRIINLIRG